MHCCFFPPNKKCRQKSGERGRVCWQLCTCVKHATQARGWHNNESTRARPVPARTSGLRLLVLIRVAITSLIQLAIYLSLIHI